jgi:GNAT superfamily N-acetyltransferase
MARRLIPAAQQPQLAEIVADWLVTEWAHLYPEWDHHAAVAELVATGDHGQPPCTWLLIESDPSAASAIASVIGSVGLALDGELESEPSLDASEIASSGPWVVNLFVTPSARGRGHGTALLEHAVNHAATLGIDELLLTTEHSQKHYASTGWRTIGTTTLNGHPSTIMILTLPVASGVTP